MPINYVNCFPKNQFDTGLDCDLFLKPSDKVNLLFEVLIYSGYVYNFYSVGYGWDPTNYLCP